MKKVDLKYNVKCQIMINVKIYILVHKCFERECFQVYDLQDSADLACKAVVSEVI